MGAGESVYTILYDRECRICSAFARTVRALSVRRTVRASPIQESRDLLRGLSESEVMDGMHAISPDGRLSTAGDAMPAILAGLAGGLAFESLLRASPPAVAGLDRVYRVLVAVRGRLTCGIASPSSAPALPP